MWDLGRVGRRPYQRKGLKSQGRSTRVSSPAGGGQGSQLGCWGTKKVLAAGNGLHPGPAGREQGEPWWQDDAEKARECWAGVLTQIPTGCVTFH